MSLRQNQRLVFQLPLRHLAGAGLPFLASETDGTAMRNQYAGAFSNISALPNGASPGFGVMFAQKAGGIASYTGCEGLGLATAAMVMGVSVVGQADGTCLVEATFGQIAAISGQADGSSTATMLAVATLNFTGSAAGLGTASAVLSAIGYLAGVAPGVGTATMTPRALGFFGGSTEGGELTPSSIASAVWTLPVDGSFTTADVLKLLAAVAAGKTEIVDLGGGNATVKFRDLNDSKDRVVADMVGSTRADVTKDVT